MKTKSRKKVHLVTLGCSKNVVDSEVLLFHLSNSGFEVSHDHETGRPDIVVINTCGFINDAREESIDTILQYARSRKEGNIGKLFVMGCLSQRYKKELETEIHEVDGFFGVASLAEVLNAIGADYRKELVGERLVTTPSHYASLKISEGCDRSCSFCAIPLIRGKHRSVTIDDLVRESSNLASKGVRELILIAQDLTWYGMDIYGKRKLSALLTELTRINGIHWIRLHYAYPAGFPPDVIDVMKNEPKICKYLDIPFQHISDRILKSMQRGHTARLSIDLINRIRMAIPDIALRTTLITGYPGETEHDFSHLCDFVREIKFDRLGVFAYSHEENTRAFSLADNIPSSVKQRRVAEIMKIQEEISLEKNKARIGQVMEVLIDRKEDDLWIGRSQYDSPEVDNEILVNSDLPLTIGDFYTIKITSATEFDLFGELMSFPH